MKKLFSVILAFLLLMGSLVSCGTGTEDTNTTAGDHTTNAEDETRETLDIPEFAKLANAIARRRKG